MAENIVWHPGSVSAETRAAATGGRGSTMWFTGLSGSGKSTIAHRLEAELVSTGRAAYVLDGDNLRLGLNGDLGFSSEDRTENVRRIGEVARLMADAGLVVLVPVISPYGRDRALVRAMHRTAGISFTEVYVDTPIEVCERRDPKGLYSKARAGEIKGFTGIDDPYEAPERPDVTIETVRTTVDESVARLYSLIHPEGVRR